MNEKKMDNFVEHMLHSLLREVIETLSNVHEGYIKFQIKEVKISDR